MTLSARSHGDLGRWMSSWLAKTSWGHLVLLTQDSELDESESSVFCRLRAKFKAWAREHQIGFCVSVPWGSGPWAGNMGLSCSAPCWYVAGSSWPSLEAVICQLTQSWDPSIGVYHVTVDSKDLHLLLTSSVCVGAVKDEHNGALPLLPGS